MIDRVLIKNGFDGDQHFKPVEKEQGVGRSKALYIRYGSFQDLSTPSGALGLFKANKLGHAVDGDGKPILHRGRPINLEKRLTSDKDEWIQIFDKLMREGEIERDDRKKLAPTWAAPPPRRREKVAVRRALHRELASDAPTSLDAHEPGHSTPVLNLNHLPGSVPC
ncbi:hypothetical protein [Nannocystis pusilla]|uniref:hypothetical protein n=1 Tax=Nannocystis pusilla TaxID=889268 RepID=UPI003BF1BF4F